MVRWSRLFIAVSIVNGSGRNRTLKDEVCWRSGEIEERFLHSAGRLVRRSKREEKAIARSGWNDRFARVPGPSKRKKTAKPRKYRAFIRRQRRPLILRSVCYWS